MAHSSGTKKNDRLNDQSQSQESGATGFISAVQRRQPKSRGFARSFSMFASGLLVGVIGTIAVTWLYSCNFFAAPSAERNVSISSQAVREAIKNASDLTTLRYYYTEIGESKDAAQFFGADIPFTQNWLLYTYNGNVGVGVDLADITDEDIIVDNEAKVIKLNVPKIKVISNEIDSTSYDYYIDQHEIFSNPKTETFTKLQAAEKEAAAERIMKNEAFLKQARDNVALALKGFLTTGDYKEYEVVVLEDGAEVDVPTAPEPTTSEASITSTE